MRNIIPHVYHVHLKNTINISNIVKNNINLSKLNLGLKIKVIYIKINSQFKDFFSVI